MTRDVSGAGGRERSFSGGVAGMLEGQPSLADQLAPSPDLPPPVVILALIFIALAVGTHEQSPAERSAPQREEKLPDHGPTDTALLHCLLVLLAHLGRAGPRLSYRHFAEQCGIHFRTTHRLARQVTKRGWAIARPEQHIPGHRRSPKATFWTVQIPGWVPADLLRRAQSEAEAFLFAAERDGTGALLCQVDGESVAREERKEKPKGRTEDQSLQLVLATESPAAESSAAATRKVKKITNPEIRLPLIATYLSLPSHDAFHEGVVPADNSAAVENRLETAERVPSLGHIALQVTLVAVKLHVLGTSQFGLAQVKHHSGLTCEQIVEALDRLADAGVLHRVEQGTFCLAVDIC